MLIIFDLDGTLVDTEKVFYRAVRSLARSTRQPITFDDYRDSVVMRGENISDLLGLHDRDAEAFNTELSHRYSQMLRDSAEVNLKAGALECLEAFRQAGATCILVTNSHRCHVELLLDRFDLRQYFVGVFTRDDGFPPKPDPAVFQHILETYDSQAWDCVVVEDSLRGVSAATALHIPCIVVPNEYSARKFAYPPQVVAMKSLSSATAQRASNLMAAAKPKTDFTLPQVFGDSASRLDAVFKVYRDLYGLDEFVCEDNDVEPAAFEYARKRLYFISLALITQDGRVYFQRSFDSGHLSLMLPGAAIHMEKGEGIRDAINRAANHIFGDVRLADVAPVALLRNHFRCTDGREVEHVGLGFRALLLHSPDELAEKMADISVKGCLVEDFDPSKIEQPPSRNTYGQVREWLKGKSYDTYVNEIEVQLRILWRYRLHQMTVNPLLKLLSRVFGRHSLSSIKARVRQHLQGSRLIDVACGDDREIIRLAADSQLIVANDIAIDQLQALEKRVTKYRRVMPRAHALFFTNHNCLDLPFRKDAFDAALCSNLLHHMHTGNDLQLLLRNLRRVARRIVLVEVEDPGKRGFWGRLLHMWYMRFLKDQGDAFFNREDFQHVLQEEFSQDRVKFEFLPTIRSTYMIAVIDRG